MERGAAARWPGSAGAGAEASVSATAFSLARSPVVSLFGLAGRQTWWFWPESSAGNVLFGSGLLRSVNDTSCLAAR